mmetsp:Transcript_21109/g.48891  ORF Transcript_21109/g.48891 Transcript_21109/m.48891 type:complete len:404 (-) Transcript_21109:503-1714(-)
MGCSFSTHHDANVAVEKRPRRCCCIKWCSRKQHSEQFLASKKEAFDLDENFSLPTDFKPSCIEPPSPASVSPVSRSMGEAALSHEVVKDRDVEDEKFFSCDDEACAEVQAMAPSGPSVSRDSTPKTASVAGTPAEMSHTLLGKSLQQLNSNRVSHFRWCSTLLQSIATSSSAAFAGSGRDSSPLFVVAGACPNRYCGIPMQAVLFSHVKTPESERDGGFDVDFWWIKPSRTNPEIVEPGTLSLHAAGSFRNVPGGSSRSIYAPLAEKFKGDEDEDDDGSGGDFRFGVDQQGRAYIEEEEFDGRRSRMLIYLVWQEAWSSAMSRNKFIRGKICYQKSELRQLSDPACSDSHRSWTPALPGFFSREYEFRSSGGLLSIAPKCEEEEWATIMPPDSFQEMTASFQC